jgi:exopolysaccharide production protein ExoZ
LSQYKLKQKLFSWCNETFEIAHTAHNSILSMEGIRGFAVFLVFLVHYVTLISPWLNNTSATANIAFFIHSIGNIGVDLFFVLSGYLIYGMLIKRKTHFPRYLIRRIQRIYPTFLVVFAIYLILSMLFPSESKLPNEWKDATLLIVQNFFLLPGLFNIEAINTVTWSLSYEFFYYLIMPFLIAILYMRNWRPIHRVGFFIVLSILLFVYFAHFEGPIRLLMFLSGIVLYDAVNSKLISKAPPLGLPALVAALITVVSFKVAGLPVWATYIVLYILFFIFCLESFVRAGLTRKIFSNRYLRWLGNMSYAYYLIHGLTLKAAFMILAMLYPGQQTTSELFWLLLIPMFVFTLIPSSLLFIFVEKPYSLSTKNTLFNPVEGQAITSQKMDSN